MFLTQLDACGDDRVRLRVNLDELGTMGQALNEVCNGLYVADLEAKMGLSELETETILDSIVTIYRKMEPLGITDLSVHFGRRELGAIIGALQEVCEVLDPREFATRMGTPRSEVDHILKAISPMYQRMNQSRAIISE